MELSYIITAITAILSFSICYSWLHVIMVAKNSVINPPLLRKYSYTPLYLCIIASFIITFFLFKDEPDLLFTPQLLDIIIPLFVGGAIFIFFNYINSPLYRLLAILIAVGIASLTIPHSFLLFGGELPFWADRCLIILIWFAFSVCYKYLNGIEGILTIQTMGIFGGLIVLFFLGVFPIMYTMLSFCIIAIMGAFLIYNWYPEKLSFNDGACSSLGFICGWMLIISGQEGVAPCTTIFSMIFIYEVLWALIKKMSFQPQFQNIYSNTNYYQANISGLSPADVCQNIIKMQIILIAIGGFEVYAPNGFSLPIFCFILVAWLGIRMKNWQIIAPTFKQLNKELVEDITENINEIKQNIRKDN